MSPMNRVREEMLGSGTIDIRERTGANAGPDYFHQRIRKTGHLVIMNNNRAAR